jgi:TonB-linked SusC/RagA family outer membrane protein
MKRNLTLLFSLLLVCQGYLYAQDVRVTGRISGPQNEALAGVTVTVGGTSQATVTNTDGNFTITAPRNANLVITHVGYLEQSVALNGRTELDIKLAADSRNLEDVVVTALGIRKESKRLGYATATVNADQISTNRTPNVASGLQGKLAGVNISTMGTGPAGSTKIRIRGQSSFASVNSPLFVINGVPMDNTSFGIGSGIGARAGQVNSSDGGDALSSINPDDIESMTVLKGATASALYGSRAKDGVVMITTKSRGSGKGIGLDYNINYTTDTPLDFTDFQYEYGQGERGVRPTTAFPQSGVWSFGEKFEPGMTQVLFDNKVYPYQPVRDRYKKFYQTGQNLTNTITLSNGGELGGFSLSLSNTDNKGIMPNSKFNRRSINLGFSQNITKGLTVTGNANYSNEKNTNPPQVNTQDMAVPTVLFTLANSMPFEALADPTNQVDADGKEIPMSRFLVRNNPYYSLSRRFENIGRDRLIGNIAVRYQITDWMYFQGRIAQDMYTRSQEYNIPNGYAPIPAAPTGFINGSYTQDVRRFRERNYDFLLGGNRKINNFGVDITLGGNQMYRRSDYNSVSVTDFVQPGLYTIMNGRAKDPIYAKRERKVNSLYGAAEFSYNNLLFLNVTARNDWFSTLAPANRSILYPSVTASFVFTDAFKNLPDWISYGKFRAAYAEVGDDNVAEYSNVLYYAVNNNLFPNPSGQNIPVGGINGSLIPNANLKPLRVSETEFGVELRLFNNRIGLDVSYYNKITKDQILAAQVSDASSYTNQLINVGRSKNQGLEILLTGSPIMTKSFKWDVSVNVAYNTSKVLQLGLTPADTVISVSSGGGRIVKQVVGKPIGALYTFLYRRDAEGRQVFDAASGRPLRNNTDSYVGNVLPKYFGGITNTFTYKGIVLTALIDYKLGAKMIAGSNMNALRHGLHKRTLVGRAEGYVIGVGVNPDGRQNSTKSDIQPFYETPNVLGVNEDFIFNAGFWKLRQLTLGYDLTKYLGKIKFIKGVRLSAVANNVWVIKKWTENMDPENVANISDNDTGLDFWTAVPPTRSIGANLHLKF